MNEKNRPVSHPDGDEHKGVVEDDSPHLRGEHSVSQESMTGQLGHRNMDDLGELIDGNDSDYPETGSTPEHSGQHQ